MTRMGRAVARLAVSAMVPGLLVATAAAQPLTADRAVQLALQNSSQVVLARANVLDARAGTYSAWSGVLPRVTASLTRTGSLTENEPGVRTFGTFVVPTPERQEGYSTTPQIGASWSVLNLSALTGLSSARGDLRAAELRRTATRQDVALTARRQFYDVVTAIQIANVNTEAARLARDDERRVRALFEVGSVSRSDLLRAQVRTAQSELDSLTARHAITVQRIALANLLGVQESALGEIDTLLTAEPREYVEADLLAEARRSRPDLQAADASVRAARSGVTSARFRRLPYVTLSGTAQFKPTASSLTTAGDSTFASRSESERDYFASVALNVDLFNGFATEAGNAAARAQLLRAEDARDVLQRNLAGEVHEALLAYREAVERDRVARRALESATETVKLTQQKYNVGSATILELIDAQVELQRARSQQVSALAAIRVAEAALERVRGRAE